MSNFVRLYALYNEGGIYFDTDVEIIRNFSTLLNESCFFGFQPKGEINNAVMGSVKKHDFMKELVDTLPLKYNGLEEAHLSSPGLVTEALRKRGLKEHIDTDKDVVRVDNITIFPQRYFYPYAWWKKFDPHCIKKDTFAVHYWMIRWQKKTNIPTSLPSRIMKFIRSFLTHNIFMHQIGALYFLLHFPGNKKVSKCIRTETLAHKIISFCARKNKDFFFIQIGSCDGIKDDPLRRYVLKYHWSGILIEPVRYLFQKLVEGYAESRNLIFENIAISDTGGLKDFYYLKQSSLPLPPWYDELGSFCKDIILKHEKEIPNIEQYISVKKVKTSTLEALMQKHNVKKIHLLCIDTEGYDYEILKTFDFSKIKPTMILFEHKHLSDADRRESKTLLRKYNYSLLKIGPNTFGFNFNIRTRLSLIFSGKLF